MWQATLPIVAVVQASLAGRGETLRRGFGDWCRARNHTMQNFVNVRFPQSPKQPIHFGCGPVGSGKISRAHISFVIFVKIANGVCNIGPWPNAPPKFQPVFVNPLPRIWQCQNDCQDSKSQRRDKHAMPIGICADLDRKEQRSRQRTQQMPQAKIFQSINALIAAIGVQDICEHFWFIMTQILS